MTTQTKQHRILSIDAWRDGEDGWYWNDTRLFGYIDASTLKKLKTPRKILRWMRAEGFLSAQSAGKVCVHEDDAYIEIQSRRDGEPLYAIELSTD